MNTCLRVLSTLFLCSLAWSPPARAEEPTPQRRLVVLDLKASGVAPTLARNLSDVLLEALRSGSPHRVVGRSEIAVILEHEGQRTLLGCSDESCVARVGDALKADLLCSGSVGLVGNAWLLNLSLTDAKTAQAVSRASETALAESELIPAVQRAARALLGSQQRERSRVERPVLAPRRGRLSLAVLDLTASGVSPQIAENLTQVMVHEVKNLPKASVISRDEVRALLLHQKDKALTGCDDAGCLAELGGALGVEYLVSGTVGRVGETYLLHLKLISIREARIVNRVAEAFAGEEGQLLAATRFAARGLVGLSRDGDGELEVRPSVSDARLFLDGKPLELSGPRALGTGKYNLRLEAEGHQPWFSDVYVDAGQRTRLDVSLTALPSPWYRKWWVWTVVGVVVAGAAVGTTVALTQKQPAANNGPQTYPFSFEAPLPQP